jgi:hypothetical protein
MSTPTRAFSTVRAMLEIAVPVEEFFTDNIPAVAKEKFTVTGAVG